MKKKVLFITGSPNQTSQMLQIASELPDLECWYSQIFTDSAFLNFILKHTTLLDSTVLSHRFRERSEAFLAHYSLQKDYKAVLNRYDLVVYCSDMLIPARMRGSKIVWVQEGMIDKPTLASKIVQALKLPAYFTGNTALNGSGNLCDIYCAASPGYRNHFIKNGTDANKVVVTGMPNYDNTKQYLDNHFPHHNYVMVATSDMRETYRYENRRAFIKSAVKIAAGRQMLFKLHPNENFDRAEREIRRYAPAGTLIFKEGNTNHMIANCCELITQYSTVVYTGIALGKKVHSWFDVDELKKLAPMQNGGHSAKNIARLCRALINHKGDKATFNAQAAMDRPAGRILIEELILN